MTLGGPPGRVAVLADDLAGALASAAALASQVGAPVPVVTAVGDPVPPQVVLNTNSRHELPNSAWFRSQVERIWKSGTHLFDQRIDSTLRGLAGRELAWLVEALPEVPLVMVLAAYPSAGRYTKGGQQWLKRAPLGGVADALTVPELAPLLGAAANPWHPVPPLLGEGAISDAVKQMGTGPGLYIFDASATHHLQAAAEVVNRVAARVSRPVVLVSSGAILHYVPKPPPRPVAVVLGSRSVQNQRQLGQLGRSGQVVIRSVWDAPGCDGWGEPPRPVRVLTSWARRLAPGRATDRALAEAFLRHWQAWQEDHYRPVRLIVSGGDTAAAILAAAAAERVDARRLLAPLVGSGVVVGGQLGQLELVTKGGRVGTAELLTDLVATAW